MGLALGEDSTRGLYSAATAPPRPPRRGLRVPLQDNARGGRAQQLQRRAGEPGGGAKERARGAGRGPSRQEDHSQPRAGELGGGAGGRNRYNCGRENSGAEPKTERGRRGGKRRGRDGGGRGIQSHSGSCVPESRDAAVSGI